MKRLSLIVVLVASLAGCASRPIITYHKIDKPISDKAFADKITDSYFLNTTVIKIAPSEPDDSSKPSKLISYTVTSEVVEARNFKVGIEPKNSFIRSTKLNIIKAENSDRAHTIGVVTTDNLVKAASSVGGLLVKAAGLVGAIPGDKEKASCTKALAAPFLIDVSELLSHKSEVLPYQFVKDDSSTRCIQLEVGSLPPDAMSIDLYPWGVETSNYYYSACREVKLTVTYPDKRVLVKSFKIADPHYIQAVQYPYTGSITMHSQCGVSVKTDGMSNPLNAIEAMTEIVKQLGDVKKAY